MNNLKRVLSLALTGAMLSGLMVMGAGAADFVDAEDIQHTEAVETVTALNIFNGKPVEGGKVEFDPDATIRRDEMAKIIAYVMNGGKEPVYSTSNYTFTDVPATQWAQKYIYYCAANGIISGDGAGHFMPEQNVTASQAAKMILTVLGYNSDVFGFIGIDWEGNTNSWANRPENNLYEDFGNYDPSQPVTRELVALMVYNALDANIMEVTYNVNADGTNNGHSLNRRDDKTLLTEKFGAKEYVGVVMGNEYADLTKADSKLDEGKTLIHLSSIDGASSTDKPVIDIASGKDELGRQVTFYGREVKNKVVIVGTLAMSADNKVVTDSSSKTYVKAAKDGKLTYAEDGLSYYKNYNEDSDNAPGFETIAEGATGDDLKVNDGTVGVERIFVDNNGDGDVDILFENTSYLGQVTKKSTKDDGSITVKTADSSALALNNKAKKAVVGFDDVEKDDMVMVSKAGGVYYVTLADSIEGKSTKFKGTTGVNVTELTVDGKAYKVSAVAIPTGISGLTAAKTYEVKNNAATFYLDPNGNIVAVGDIKETAKEYAYVLGYSKAGQVDPTTGTGNIDSNRIKVKTTDGTTKTYTLASGSKGTATDANPKLAIGQVITYKINDDGELKVTDIVIHETAAQTTFTKGKTTVADSTYANNTTVFFYVTMKDGLADTVDIYTGYRNAPSVGTDKAKVTYGVAKDGTTAEVVLFVDATSPAASTDFLYVESIGATDVENDTTDVNVILTGEDEVTTISVKENEAAKGDLCTFTVNAKGQYELTKVTLGAAAKVVNVGDTTIVVGSDELTIGDKAMTYDVSDADAGVTAYVGGIHVAKGDKVQLYKDGSDVLAVILTEAAE